MKYIVSFSGGKDSTAMLLRLLDLFSFAGSDEENRNT